MEKILIVDGSNLLFQMFFGMPSRIYGRDGRAIHGTLGFVGALLKIIRRVSPTRVLAIFDGEHKNSRCELDPAYKANRPDYGAMSEAENPFSQLPDIYTALDFLGICHAETEDCEADDTITGYVLALRGEMDVVISSFDSDFFQLIGEHVTVLRYRGDRTVLCDPAYIVEKFGISPEQYADFKSLVGDTADNIKGADMVGPKTAAQLLNAFGTLEGVIGNAERIARPSVRNSILANAERLRRNYRLIKLCGCESLPFAKDALAFHGAGLTTTQVLKGIGLM